LSLRHSLIIIFLGPAGAGKTSLTNKLGEWIAGNEGLRVGLINLDPAADYLPYKPDFDVRAYVNALDLMRSEGLGPNGAIVRAVELMALKSSEIIKNILRIRADVLLVDTPGQSEVFLLRSAGPKIISLIKGLAPTVGVYVTDPSLGTSASEAVIVFLMSVITQLRLGIPTLPVINKVDLSDVDSSQEDVITIKLSSIREQLLYEGTGLLSELTHSLLNTLIDYLPAARVLRVSAKTGFGIGQLFKYVHEALCVCGDLT